MYRIYTDGGCQPNPGVGGWGVLIIHPNGERQELSGVSANSTNNIMEITAALNALKATDEGSTVELITDSQYVRKSMTEWVYGWIKKGWKGVKNKELLQQLYKEAKKRNVTWTWVRGHSGDENNEYVDQLARAAIFKCKAVLELASACSEHVESNRLQQLEDDTLERPNQESHKS